MNHSTALTAIASLVLSMMTACSSSSPSPGGGSGTGSGTGSGNSCDEACNAKSATCNLDSSGCAAFCSSSPPEAEVSCLEALSCSVLASGGAVNCAGVTGSGSGT